MEYRQCGDSGLHLSVIGAGCWAFGGGEYWGSRDQGDVDKVVRRCFELGINYFDTAEAYNEGRSETSLGLAIRGFSREALVIGSKVSPSNCYRDSMIASCEASLQRLGTDYIDLYMIHWPIHTHSIRHFSSDQRILESPPDIHEAMDTLADLQKQGKIRYAGVSNFDVERFEDISGYGTKLVVNQLPYSLLTRAIEDRMFPYCTDNRIGIIGYMTLLQGLLADKFADMDSVPPYQRRTRHFNCSGSNLCRHGEAGAEAETTEALATIRNIMAETGTRMAELAIRWTVAKKEISCALVGASRESGVEENARAAETPLDPEIVRRMDDATKALKDKLGDSFDYYESQQNNRTR